jgi:hypothetical protein
VSLFKILARREGDVGDGCGKEACGAVKYRVIQKEVYTFKNVFYKNY